jgi:hypothetical protein
MLQTEALFMILNYDRKTFIVQATGKLERLPTTTLFCLV